MRICQHFVQLFPGHNMTATALSKLLKGWQLVDYTRTGNWKYELSISWQSCYCVSGLYIMLFWKQALGVLFTKTIFTHKSEIPVHSLCNNLSPFQELLTCQNQRSSQMTHCQLKHFLLPNLCVQISSAPDRPYPVWKLVMKFGLKTISKLTSDTWYMYIAMVAMETALACDLRYLLSGPSLASSITNMIGSSTQIPSSKEHYIEQHHKLSHIHT